MAMITFSLALTGAAQGDNFATVGKQNNVVIGDKGILSVTIVNASGNGAVTVGPQFGGTFTSTPWTIADGGTLTLGPFLGASYTRTKEYYFKGTSGKSLTGVLITH